jgi:hypothetical protein
MASLTSVTPTVQSAQASSFTGPDATGTMVMGWTLEFTGSKPGTDCRTSEADSASIGIFTNQMMDATHKTATLVSASEISIVTQSPPSTANGNAATMGAKGVSNIDGTVMITDFHLAANGVVDHIDGSINAGGTSSAGAVALTGTFVAPICND